MLNKKFSKPLLAFGAGIALVLASSVGATRAAIIYQNEAKEVDFDTSYVSVDLFEGESVDDTERVSDVLNFPGVPEDGIHIGQKYDEYVNVVNTSDKYQEYVRVKVRKYWVKEVNGVLEKDTSLDPSLIELSINTNTWKTDDVGFKDKEATSATGNTVEETVYYLTSPLDKTGGKTSNVVNFINGITINDSVTTIVDLDGGTSDASGALTGNVTNNYIYDNASFYVEIEADAVQSHNAVDAIYGAWGVHVECDAEDDGNIIKIEGKIL